MLIVGLFVASLLVTTCASIQSKKLFIKIMSKYSHTDIEAARFVVKISNANIISRHTWIFILESWNSVVRFVSRNLNIKMQRILMKRVAGNINSNATFAIILLDILIYDGWTNCGEKMIREIQLTIWRNTLLLFEFFSSISFNWNRSHAIVLLRCTVESTEPM